MRPLMFLLFFPLLWMQCKTAQNVAGEEIVVFEMTRTLCFGSCPAYEIKIFQSGKVLYKGEKFVPLEGSKEFTLSNDDQKVVRETLGNINFFDLEDRYYKEVTDLPTTYLTYYQDGKKKEVMDYYGAPKKLKELEEKIQKIIFAYLK